MTSLARRQGFTLIELMISMSLGLLVVAGAFETHVVFSRMTRRQRQIGDMQNSMRAARDMIARAVRSAGAGFSGGAMQLYDCDAGTQTTYWPIRFSNANAYAHPMPVDTDPSNREVADPDWIRTVALEPDSRVTLTAVGANTLTVADVSGFKVGDYLYAYNGDVSPDPARHLVLARKITSVTPTAGGPGGTLGYCFPGPDTAMTAIAMPGALYATARWATFRIDTTVAATPQLTVSYDRPGPNPTWQALGPDFEDLQIALVQSDGTVCGRAGNSVDAPSLCNPLQLRAVRFTLTARSSSTVPGFRLGRAGGAEDELPSAQTDSWLRRAVTSEIEVRNLLP